LNGIMEHKSGISLFRFQFHLCIPGFPPVASGSECSGLGPWTGAVSSAFMVLRLLASWAKSHCPTCTLSMALQLADGHGRNFQQP
jgi:hypothetical protein